MGEVTHLKIYKIQLGMKWIHSTKHWEIFMKVKNSKSEQLQTLLKQQEIGKIYLINE